MIYVFFFKQKTAYEMRISDWSSDVCSSDLTALDSACGIGAMMALGFREGTATVELRVDYLRAPSPEASCLVLTAPADVGGRPEAGRVMMRAEARETGGNSALAHAAGRSEEHTSELQSLMRRPYGRFHL